MDNLGKPGIDDLDDAARRGLDLLCVDLVHLQLLGVHAPRNLVEQQYPFTQPQIKDDLLAKSKAHLLIDQFNMLSDDERGEFCDRLGSQFTGPTIFRMVGHLPREEKEKFSDMINEWHTMNTVPFFIEHALQVIEEMPNAGREEKLQAILLQSSAAAKEVRERVSNLEREKLAAKRNRQSDPETIKRNVEICNLRIEDPSLWTQGKLAKKYEMSPKGIRNILSEEPKWRRLYALQD